MCPPVSSFRPGTIKIMGPNNLINSTIALYLANLHSRLMKASRNIHQLQDSQLKSFVHKALKTEVGREYGFYFIKDYATYTRQVPVITYEDIRLHIQRMMQGETNILWPGLITWFAKSSGTTSDKSKFIPVSTEHLNHTHTRGGWYSLALLYHRFPDARVFADLNLVLTGSITRMPHPDIRYGDVSAIMLHHMPWIGRPFFTPDIKTCLLPDWDKKLEIMARICSKKNVGVIGGVPTWAVVLFRQMLELTGKSNMLEIWPNASVYMHGGVGFGPYQEQFGAFFPSEKFLYQEIYNASEGYFASQDTDDRTEGLLLLPDNGIFYEFIPEGHWQDPNPPTIQLKDIELGTQYALVITTNGGLWRYKIGDTVMFTSRNPYRLCITGRTQQYINAFGEELMVDNADKAIEITARAHHAIVTDYTAAPFYMSLHGKGGHHWLIEFEQAPANLQAFADQLDAELKKLNSDYEAKRFQGMALERLRLTALPIGTFRKWLSKNGKAGSQAKVPRLSNDRKYLDDILSMISPTITESKSSKPDGSEKTTASGH
ncbi:MAG TPA: GH3 auxin-responsive promoter family protein [Saprospiraceae bacterium]|nr:GH3 auxin-responsive promoter family protein [Saprospiraceae bacterium]